MVLYVKNKKTKHKRNKIYGNFVTKKKIQITSSLNIDQTYVLHQHIHRTTYTF